MSEVLLQADAVAKHFGGVRALRDVTLTGGPDTGPGLFQMAKHSRF